MTILSAWRARCDRNAELRDERNDLIHSVNNGLRALQAGDSEASLVFFALAQRSLNALKTAANKSVSRNDQH